MNKLITILLLLLLASPAFAADKPAADMKERLELARQYQKIRPVSVEVNKTVDELGASLPADQNAKYKADMHRVFDYKSVEEAAVQAMADTFTAAEIKAMVEYYSKPEAKSAVEKLGDYQEKFKPAIRAAFDRAMTDLVYPKTPAK